MLILYFFIIPLKESSWYLVFSYITIGLQNPKCFWIPWGTILHFHPSPQSIPLTIYSAIYCFLSFQMGEGNGTPLQYSCLEIPWAEEPGRLQSMGSWRVGHNWATSLSLFTFMHWRRKWQPTPVFLPGESQGQGSLVGCHLWDHTESGHDWSDLAAAAAPSKCLFWASSRCDWLA